MRLLYKNNGFTLYEILVAIAVLTIASLGTTTLTLTVLHRNAISNKAATATTLAQDKLEDIKRLGFAAAATSTEYLCFKPDGSNTTDSSDKNCSSSNNTYKRVTAIVTAVANTPGAKPTETVTVTVSWGGDANNPHKKVALNTILAQ